MERSRSRSRNKHNQHKPNRYPDRGNNGQKIINVVTRQRQRDFESRDLVQNYINSLDPLYSYDKIERVVIPTDLQFIYYLQDKFNTNRLITIFKAINKGSLSPHDVSLMIRYTSLQQALPHMDRIMKRDAIAYFDNLVNETLPKNKQRPHILEVIDTSKLSNISDEELSDIKDYKHTFAFKQAYVDFFKTHQRGPSVKEILIMKKSYKPQLVTFNTSNRSPLAQLVHTNAFTSPAQQAQPHQPVKCDQKTGRGCAVSGGSRTRKLRKKYVNMRN